MITVGFWPIFAAGIASVLIGWVWFNPRVFGGPLMRASNLSPEEAERAHKRMPVSALFALMASMVAAYVMYYFGVAWGVYDWLTALQLGFWCWIGFAAPPLLGSVLWERRPLRYFVSIAGFWLVSFAAMAIILTFFANVGF